MRLNKSQINKIKNKQVTFVKKFTTIEHVYDFNKISKLVDDYSLFVDSKASTGEVFRTIWRLKEIDKVDTYLFMYKDFTTRLFKYVPESRDGVDLFFSFVTNTGIPHFDEEDVFLIGLYGKTIYRITHDNKDYEINSGDLLHIPKGTWHKAISYGPRVVASIGYYGGKST